MENDTESEKLGVIIFGQKFCSKLEHIPIKKRILLRDSAMYQRTPSSVELNQKIDYPPIPQNSILPGSPIVGKHSDPNDSSNQQADNLKPLQLNGNFMETVAVNMEASDSHPLYHGLQTPVGVIVDKEDKDPRADAETPSTKGEMPSISSFAPVASRDSLVAKQAGTVPSLTGSVTVGSYSAEKSVLQPDHVSCKDLEDVQSVSRDNRILWDLNVEMDAWGKPDNLLKGEYKSDPTTAEVLSDSNLERSEDYRLKRETVVPENDTENNVHPLLESLNSDDICKHERKTSDSADGERYGSCGEDQQFAAGSSSGKIYPIAKTSMEIECMNLSCNYELASKTDETLRLCENTSDLFDCAPRRDPRTVCATPNSSFVSTEEQNCDSKNIIIEGEGSFNILPISSDEDNVLTKKETDSKAGQHDVTRSSSAYQLEQRASVKESNLCGAPVENNIAETIKAAHSARELTVTSPNHVDTDMGNPLLRSFPEGCDASIVQSVGMSAVANQGVSIVRHVPDMDKDFWAHTEQDYEDGELREMDMHCWNEDETKTGEIECLDYEPDIEDIDDLDESQTSVSGGKGESGLKRKKSKLSITLVKDHLVRIDDVKMGLNGSGHGPHIVNTQLEKKLSGWDQLPKDGCSSSEKVQVTQGMLSRTRRSELHSCSDIPTLSEDAEDKETVVERRIRPKDMDDSYPPDCGSGFDKFNGKRRSTPHIHGRNRAEDWDSERRSSVNYHDLYDNHSGSRHINPKVREQRRSRSPYDRNEAYGSHISYSRYSRGRNGSRAEGSGRSLRGGMNGYRGSLADDRPESEFCMRPRFVRRDRSFSPRPAAHISETFIRSRSRSRTRSPPLWVPPYERLGPRIHRRSPEFSADDRVKRTRLPFWKSNYPPDSEMRYNSPPRSGYLRQNKSRWNDEEDFDLRISRDRSPVRSFGHKEKLDASSSRGSFKSNEDFRPTGYRGRMRELTPDRVRGYISGKDRRKHEGSFEAGQRKHYYKDSFARRNDAEDGIGNQNYPLKDDLLKDGETRSVNMRKKESKSHEKYEYDH